MRWFICRGFSGSLSTDVGLGFAAVIESCPLCYAAYGIVLFIVGSLLARRDRKYQLAYLGGGLLWLL